MLAGVSVRYPDRLGVDEFADAVHAELAAVAGRLTPPNGRRGSDATIPLMNTCPASISRRSARAAPSFARPDARAEAERESLASGDGLVDVPHAEDGGDRAEESPRGRPASPECRSARSERSSSRGPGRRSPPASTRAPAATVASTCAARSVAQSARRQRADVVGAVHRVTDPQRAHGRDERRTNSSAIGSDTMKRLAAMQDWPLLIVRALTAVRPRVRGPPTACTMNGSLPPSSSTGLLERVPGARATSAPAPRCRSASRRATRGSSRIGATA